MGQQLAVFALYTQGLPGAPESGVCTRWTSLFSHGQFELLHGVLADIMPLAVLRHGQFGARTILYDHALWAEVPDDHALWAEVPAMRRQGRDRQAVCLHRREPLVVAWRVSVLTDLDIAEHYQQIKAALAAG
ncbi:MAG: hypothetical protein OES46_14935 [Gammaproteobacteria bacterium]|nr:hypothetical protein [Gammaproteobacteria bacterium]